MIQKLRRKFILINMATVMVVLFIVLFLVCFSSYRSFQNASHGAMIRFLDSDSGQHAPATDKPVPAKGDSEMPREDMPRGPFPLFVVELTADGTAILTDSSSSDITSDQASQAIRLALEQGDEEGHIPSLSLRYLRDPHAANVRMVFADSSAEEHAMRGMFLTALLILTGSMFVLFIISYFLSKIALKPTQAAWDQQSRFVADASHELKTPLTVILANLKILASHPDSTIAEQRKWIDNTQDEAARMRTLVDNLLFLARSEATSAALSTIRLNLSDTLLSCLLPLESLAFEEGITLEDEISPAVFIQANEEQIKQLIYILLDNAFKYAAKQKQVTIRLYTSGEKAFLSVNNSGDPIPADELPYLFERFYRSDKSRTRAKNSYGLGLSIAKTIIKGHRGKIRVTSENDIGTTFVVSFPVAAPE